MKEVEKKKYPIGKEHYELYEEVGQGVSASVYRALCKPLNEIIAIKILDFERHNCDLNSVSREAQIMNLIDHPNILKAHCSFVSDHNLWVVMPYMAGGSCLHILKAAYPDGFKEVVIATILREVLKGLEYLHFHGHIHRDVKAGNILIDARGAIKLGDFGVTASLFDSCDRQRMRNTFVGTPCWMAPEVMEQLHGYDCKADIWSFGITALELAHGHAPFSKYPPMKVLLMTLQNAPPGLDYARDDKFSKSFKQMTASCLVKDPSKRPSAKKLLKHSFFKQARSNDYIARTLLEGLPVLGDRIKALKIKEEDTLAQKKIPDGRKEEISQDEYKRGISGWNFNIEDMKSQASLIQDVDDSLSDNNQGGSSNSSTTLDVQEKQSQCQYFLQAADKEENNAMQNQPVSLPLAEATTYDGEAIYDKPDDGSSTTSSCYEQHISLKSSPTQDYNTNSSGEKPDLASSERSLEGTTDHCHHRRGISQEVSIPPIKGESHNTVDGIITQQSISMNREEKYQRVEAAPEAVDELLSEVPSKASKPSASNSDEPDEKAKPPVVQQKGRFKVTSENVDLDKVTPSPILQKSHSIQAITQHSAIPLPTSLPPSLPVFDDTLSTHSLFPQLHSVLQSNIVQRDNILNLMKQVAAGDSTVNCVTDGGNAAGHITSMEKSLLGSAHEREKELLNEITDLQWRLICARDDLQKLKTENSQVRSPNSQ